MNDTSQLVMSWIIIFLVFAVSVVTGTFIGNTSKVNSFHAQVNPVIERYGGDTNYDVYNNGHSAQQEIYDISKNMNTKTMSFSVEPITNGHNPSNKVAGYGKPVAYKVHAHIPFTFGMNLDRNPTYYTTSKVGQD